MDGWTVGHEFISSVHFTYFVSKTHDECFKIATARRCQKAVTLDMGVYRSDQLARITALNSVLRTPGYENIRTDWWERREVGFLPDQ